MFAAEECNKSDISLEAGIPSISSHLQKFCLSYGFEIRFFVKSFQYKEGNGPCADSMQKSNCVKSHHCNCTDGNCVKSSVALFQCSKTTLVLLKKDYVFQARDC